MQLEEHQFGRPFELAVVCLGLWLLVLVIWWAKKEKRFDPFEYPLWFSIGIFGQVLLPALFFYRSKPIGYSGIPLDLTRYMPRAVILYGVGLSSLWFGYAIAYGALAKRRPRYHRLPHQPILDKVITVWAGCASISTAALMVGIQGYLSVRAGWAWENYLATFQLFQWAAWSLFLLIHFRNPTRKTTLWFWMSTLVVFGSILAAASKGAALVPMWVLMCRYYATHRIHYRSILVVALVGMAVVPVVNGVRSGLHTADTGAGVSLADRNVMLGGAIQQVSNNSILAAAGEAVETISGRQVGLLHITAAVMQRHPDQAPYVGNELLGYLAQSCIPRFLWPSKPTERPELYRITSTYLGWRNESSLSAIGSFADSYRAGGWIVLVLWSTLLGIVSAWLYGRGPVQGDAAATAFYLVFLTHFITFEMDLGTGVLRLLEMGPLIWFALSRYLCRIQPKAARLATRPCATGQKHVQSRYGTTA